MTVALQDALALDRYILLSMLQRNRCAHGRTRYFQRMEMVMKALNQNKVEALTHRLEAAKRQQRTRKSLQQEWTLEKLLHIDPHVRDLSEISDLLTIRLPSIMSRIELAASTLFYELGRGFFMPFNTIAIGALARIRIILMKLGRQGLIELKTLLADSNLKENFDFEQTMQTFVESQVNKDKNIAKHDALLKQLGIAGSKSRGQDEADNVKDEPNQESTTGTQEFNCSVDESLTQPIDSNSFKFEKITTERIIETDDFGESLDYVDIARSECVDAQDKSIHDSVDKNQSVVESLKRKRAKDDASKEKKQGRKKKGKAKKDVFDEIFGN